MNLFAHECKSLTEQTPHTHRSDSYSLQTETGHSGAERQIKYSLKMSILDIWSKNFTV